MISKTCELIISISLRKLTILLDSSILTQFTLLNLLNDTDPIITITCIVTPVFPLLLIFPLILSMVDDVSSWGDC